MKIAKSFSTYSGDQDSVVPLLGSRTLVRELAHDLKFGVTVPYGAWFHKGQVYHSEFVLLVMHYHFTLIIPHSNITQRDTRRTIKFRANEFGRS